MIQVQLLVGGLHKGYLGSDDIIRGHQQVFANNSRWKRATDMEVISLCSSCQHASPDMQHDLLGPTCDLTWPWPEVKFWPDCSRSPSTCFDVSWEEHDGAWINPLDCSVRKLFAKKNVFDKKLFLNIDLNIDISEKWTKYFRNDFWRAFERIFRFLAMMP